MRLPLVGDSRPGRSKTEIFDFYLGPALLLPLAFCSYRPRRWGLLALLTAGLVLAGSPPGAARPSAAQGSGHRALRSGPPVPRQVGVQPGRHRRVAGGVGTRYGTGQQPRAARLLRRSGSVARASRCSSPAGAAVPSGAARSPHDPEPVGRSPSPPTRSTMSRGALIPAGTTCSTEIA